MNNFKKTAGSSTAFALIYTFCMYQNTASITFPILMAAGIWFLYSLNTERKIFDNFLSGFYVAGIMLTAISVFMTDDWKLIFMSKIVVFVLYLCLAIELYFYDQGWDDARYIKEGIKILWGSIGKGFLLISDSCEYVQNYKNSTMENSKKSKSIMKIIKGILIAIPLLMIIIPLMMSADVVFQNMMNSLFDMENIFELLFVKLNVIGLGMTFLIALLLYYGFIKILIKEDKSEKVIVKKYYDNITGITITGIIGFIYGIFSVIQLRGILFTDVNLPEGYTYAEYAREGFFQLFFLAVINMIIVLVCASKFEYSKILKTILYLLCLCTYIMIFSSTYKMILYIKVYNLTFLRLMVLWALAVIFVIMAAVIRYVYSNDFSLFKFMTVVVTSFYIIIAFAKPDYVIAKYNLEMGNQMEVDKWYLNHLSCDAMPVMAEYQEDFQRYFERAELHYENMSIRKFNLSQYIAKCEIEK